MAHNVFEHGKIWRTITGLARRDARMGNRVAAPGSRTAAPRFHGASAAAALACLILTTASSFSATYNTIPALFNFINLSGRLVCVSGPTNQPFFLAPSGQAGQLGWATTAPAQSFYPVGAGTGQYSAVQSNMLGGNYTNVLNSATLRFFVMPSGTSTCPATMPASTPQGLFEFTGKPISNIPTNGDTTYQVTLDTSNVDNLQVPMMFEIISSPTSPAFIEAQLGNYVYSPHAAISTMVTGTAFPNWLNLVGGTGLQGTFGVLAQAATATSPPMVNSTKDFLASCLPSQCSLLPQAANNLFYYFDSALQNLLVQGLQTVGDAQGTIVQAVWTATSANANCPVYLNPDGKSFSFSSTQGQFIFCNPLNQVVPLPAGSTVTCITPNGCPAGTTGQNSQQFAVCVTVPSTFTLTNYNGWNFGQPAGVSPVQNISQSQSSSQSVGIITPATITAANCNPTPPPSTTSYNASFTVWCLHTVMSQPNYTCPVPGNSAWAVSNINVNLTSNCGGAMNVFETASQQVFANDGAFAPWFSFYQSPAGCTGGAVTALTTVSQSIGRNIVEALVHGVASCTSVSPPNCVPVNLIINGTSYPCVTSPGSCPPNMFWSNQNNWFPMNGTQDYYSAYIHQAVLSGNSTAAPTSAPNNCVYTPTTSWSTGPIHGLNNCSNISLPPNLYVNAQPAGCSGFGGFARNPSWVADGHGVRIRL
jgi:hypothetical protein